MIPGLAQWVKGSGVAVSYDVGHRHSSDPKLLWLWCRPVAAALISTLVWQPPYAKGVALKRQKKKKKKKRIERTKGIEFTELFSKKFQETL